MTDRAKALREALAKTYYGPPETIDQGQSRAAALVDELGISWEHVAAVGAVLWLVREHLLSNPKIKGLEDQGLVEEAVAILATLLEAAGRSR